MTPDSSSRAPWRLGTTSFIYPGSWLHNVERLAARFDDIELLFFEGDGEHAFPDRQECLALSECKRTHRSSFSLHTPLAASLASADPMRRARGVLQVQRAIAAAELLEPEAYVLHVYFGDEEHALVRPADVSAWQTRARASLEQIVQLGIEPRRLCIETLDYDFSLIEPIVVDLDLSIALDVGHLARDGKDVLGAVERYLPRTRLIQWHGTDRRDRDHRSLEHFPAALGRDLLRALLNAQYCGVLTLELFREPDLEASLRIYQRLLCDTSPQTPSPRATVAP